MILAFSCNILKEIKTIKNEIIEISDSKWLLLRLENMENTNLFLKNEIKELSEILAVFSKTDINFTTNNLANNTNILSSSLTSVINTEAIINTSDDKQDQNSFSDINQDRIGKSFNYNTGRLISYVKYVTNTKNVFTILNSIKNL